MSLFDLGPNPADSAMPYLNQIAPMEKGYYNPFIERGRRSGDILENQYGNLTQDPALVLESWLKGYEPSRGYQLKRDEMLRAAGNTAAAGGMRGSQSDMSEAARITDRLMSDDMQEWLHNILGLYGMGLEGEQGFYGTGYNASSSLASDLGNVLGTQAQLAFQGQREKNQRKGDLLNSLIGGASGIAGSLAGFI